MGVGAALATLVVPAAVVIRTLSLRARARAIGHLALVKWVEESGFTFSRDPDADGYAFSGMYEGLAATVEMKRTGKSDDDISTTVRVAVRDADQPASRALIQQNIMSRSGHALAKALSEAPTGDAAFDAKYLVLVENREVPAALRESEIRDALVRLDRATGFVVVVRSDVDVVITHPRTMLDGRVLARSLDVARAFADEASVSELKPKLAVRIRPAPGPVDQAHRWSTILRVSLILGMCLGLPLFGIPVVTAITETLVCEAGESLVSHAKSSSRRSMSVTLVCRSTDGAETSVTAAHILVSCSFFFTVMTVTAWVVTGLGARRRL